MHRFPQMLVFKLRVEQVRTAVLIYLLKFESCMK